MTKFKTDINNQIFQDAVESLHLRFPNAEIERATGESKGNISSFLNDKKPVPDTFLQTFSDAFKIDLRQFGYTKGMERIETKNPSQESKGLNFKEDNVRLINENEFLKQTVKDLLTVLKNK